jgi:chromosome segregation ATPase
MDIAAIISVLGALVTLGGLFVQWRKSKSEVRVLNSQEKSNLADAVETAAGTLVSALKFAAEERTNFEKRIDDLEADLERAREETKLRIEETHKHRTDTDAKIEALNREYLRETQKLRDEVQTLKNLVAEGEKKYKAAKQIIEQLVAALRDNKIDLPNLDLSDLGDSIHGLKWKK